MLVGITLFALFLCAIALIQSFRADKKAQQSRLDAIRKRIEHNEKKQLIKRLQKRSEKTSISEKPPPELDR